MYVIGVTVVEGLTGRHPEHRDDEPYINIKNAGRTERRRGWNRGL